MSERMVMGKISEPTEGRIEVVKIFLEAAVNIYNDSKIRDQITGEIVKFGEVHYNIVMPDLVLDNYLEQIQTGIEQANWDKRVKARIEYTTFGKTVYLASIKMDLESTFKQLNWETQNDIPEHENKLDVSDIVEDNPSMETINELIDRDASRSESRVNIPPYRTSRFVLRNERTNR